MNNSTSTDRRYQGKDTVSQPDGSPVMLAFYIIILVIGLIENSLVLVVIFIKKGSKTANDIFIANLTISDLTFITFASPSSIYIYFEEEYASIFVCKFVWPIITATYLVSVATVASMAVQRCYVILNPFKPKIKKRTLISWLVGIWFLSFLLVIPQIIATNVSPARSCSEEWPSQIYPRLYTISLFTLQYVFPLAIISVSYIRIGFYATRSRHTSKQLETDALKRRRLKDERAIKRTIIIILMLFLLLMLPNQVAYFLLDFGSPDQKRAAKNLLKYVDIPTFFHCCVNPIIYGTVSRQFREGYVRCVSFILHLCSGKRSSNKNEHSSETAFLDDLAGPKDSRRRKGGESTAKIEQEHLKRRGNEREPGFIANRSSGSMLWVETRV